MKAHACPLCGARMKRNGRTSAGRTRWRCTSCGASTARRIDSSAKLLESFLGWLLTRKRQADMPGGGRAFRRKTARFWEIWPMPPKVEAPRRVVYVDGIRLGRKAVVLIASDGERVLGWHPCRSENSRAWAVPMSRIAEPEVAVSDGGDGRPRLIHERLVKARRSLVRLVDAGTLFTYLDPGLTADGPLHRRDIRADGRAGEAGGHHPPMGRRDRVVGAALLGAVPDGLGLAGHTFCPITPNPTHPRTTKACLALRGRLFTQDYFA